MDASVVWDMQDIVQIVGASAPFVLLAILWYTLKHNRDERQRKDKEHREKTRRALKRMYEELNDTHDAIEKGEARYECRDKEGKKTKYLKQSFHYVECENLILTSEIREVNIELNEIKDIIGYIKLNNKIFEWMENTQPPYKGTTHDIKKMNDDYGEKTDECSMKMAWYQKQLREKIPIILEKINEECKLLS